jgi:hypothetical protein
MRRTKVSKVKEAAFQGASLLVLLICCHAAGAQGVPKPDKAPPVPRPPRFVPTGAHLANADEIRRKLGLSPEYDKVPVENIKIAVLDYGFEGLAGAKQYLPANTTIVEHYDPEFVRRFKLGDPGFKKSFAPANSHGRTLAQIIWAMTGLHANGPKFYLLNANGPTLLRRAVRYAMEAKVDIILFSGVFEGAGNGDGRGPINDVVSDALAAGILWINAAGNFGGRVYNGPVDVAADGWLRLGGGPAGTALRFRNFLDENTVTITLTWNDYREQEDAGTDKDLDLYVEDGQGQRIAASEKVQVPAAGKATGPDETRNPRERVVLTDLPASPDQDYRIRIRVKKGKFTPADRIRVLLTSKREAYFDPESEQSTPAVRFVDASGKGEIFPPADHPLVLAVGEINPTSGRGPTADHRVKPDVILPDSRALFTNGEISLGTSNSAAYFAAVVALMKAAEPGLSVRHLLWLAHYGQAHRVAVDHDGMPLSTTGSAARFSRPQAAVNPRSPAGSRSFVTANARPRALPSPPRPIASVSRPGSTTAARYIRVWQTPTLEELKKVVQDR